MERYTIEQRIKVVEAFYENGRSNQNAFRALRDFFGQNNRPNVSTIGRIVRKFQQTGSVENVKTPVNAHTVLSAENIAAVRDSVAEDPSISTRRRAQQLNISRTSLMRILKKELNLNDDKMGSDQQTIDIGLPAAKKMKVYGKCVLRWAKITEQAFEPVQGSERAAGLDLRSAYDIIVPARGKALVKTDLQIEVPTGSYGRVAPRSGLAVKNFIDVGAGVVDEDYRGNLGVVLFNHSENDFEVNRGDRIAQLICERIFYPELEHVDKETEQGEEGFRSTGVKDLPSVVAEAVKHDNETKGK